MFDKFSPTEHFFTDSKKKYMCLEDEGIKEKDVKVITN